MSNVGSPTAPIRPAKVIFEQGTLLIRGDRSLSLPAAFVWDPRVDAWRAPPHRWRDVRAALKERGMIDEVRHAAAANRPIAPRHAIQLRPYQEAAISAWEIGGRRGLLVMPTGSGKTRAAIAAIARTRVPALCIVPTILLLEQWRDLLAAAFGMKIGALGGGDRELEPITVSTFESAYRHMANIGNRFGLLVVDEAHHFGERIRDEAIEMSIAPYRLGLTATPPTEPRQCARLFDLIGPIMYELSIPELAGGYLAPFQRIVLGVDLSPEERSAYDRDRERFLTAFRHFRRLAPEAGWSDFARFAKSSEPGRAAMAAHTRMRRLISYTRGKSQLVSRLLARHAAGRTLIFTADNEATYAVAREHLVMPITCEIGRKERDEAFVAFRAGNLRALVSARVLNEGIDVPDADVAIVVSAAFGEREHVQRVGRLLRPREGKQATVYELIARDTVEEQRAEKRGKTLGNARWSIVQYRREHDHPPLSRSKRSSAAATPARRA
jgi:superfamily II DNA or RNA helicase